MEEKHRRLLIPFSGIIGGTLGLLTFFDSPSLVSYLTKAFLLGLGATAVAWATLKLIENPDRLKNLPLKKKLGLSVVLLTILGLVVIFLAQGSLSCFGHTEQNQKNVLTGECRTVAVGCGLESPWYYQDSKQCKPAFQPEGNNTQYGDTLYEEPGVDFDLKEIGYLLK